MERSATAANETRGMTSTQPSRWRQRFGAFLASGEKQPAEGWWWWWWWWLFGGGCRAGLVSTDASIRAEPATAAVSSDTPTSHGIVQNPGGRRRGAGAREDRPRRGRSSSFHSQFSPHLESRMGQFIQSEGPRWDDVVRNNRCRVLRTCQPWILASGCWSPRRPRPWFLLREQRHSPVGSHSQLEK